MLKVTLSVCKLEALLDAKFYYYYSVGASTTKVLASKSYSLPASVADYIDLVTPSTSFAYTPFKRNRRVHKPESKANRDLASAQVKEAAAINSSACDSNQTPTCIRNLYNMTSFKPKMDKVNSIGVIEVIHLTL